MQENHENIGVMLLHTSKKVFDSVHRKVTSWTFRKAVVEALPVCALMTVYEAREIFRGKPRVQE